LIILNTQFDIGKNKGERWLTNGSSPKGGEAMPLADALGTFGADQPEDGEYYLLDKQTETDRWNY
jgi:hypothetical protein